MGAFVVVVELVVEVAVVVVVLFPSVVVGCGISFSDPF